ncbi:Adaptive-response sensory-kinase SasA [Caprobacter fermentans]|uniref:histidine kinase n=1 Tax=Caproicibacter fermentans TaxID=2576756 RepID=A0A6N8HY75_9FIRM|nr:HAMP domain-containing sensor histidine kinase [Caproicibacter fermentans]MVB10776.1 Adaptive-response sensory-kinase SasA [Caproicibacter fermentans]OCN00522.1 hypothetical protein A7X67_16900 [Clostridium sp. W14A]
MEWIKQANIKKSFFSITALFLLIGVILGIASFFGCVASRDNLSTSGQFTVDFGKISPSNPSIQVTGLSNDWRVMAISVFQIVLPVLFVILSLLLADLVFYRIKLKKPLAILKSSAERIQRQDLDFTVEKCSDDELGTLCSAFEMMRTELLKNNQELWRQMEERKRLNAAFSHDLRNPVTVLKGSAKLLEKELKQGALTAQKAEDTIALITQYAGRIENYVEAMTNAQKLEELKCIPKLTHWRILANSLKDSLTLLNVNMEKKFEFSSRGEDREIFADQSIIQCTAENLVGNALRYAKEAVSVDFTYKQDRIVLTISDDGSGFSSTILQKGATPFLRDDLADGQEHFGMGLYVCRLLCEKHGGSLSLKNTPNGAKAIAVFSVLNP